MKKESYDAMAQQINLLLAHEECAILDKFQEKLGFEDRELLDLLILVAAKFNSAGVANLRTVRLPLTVRAEGKFAGAAHQSTSTTTSKHNPKKK